MKAQGWYSEQIGPLLEHRIEVAWAKQSDHRRNTAHNFLGTRLGSDSV